MLVACESGTPHGCPLKIHRPPQPQAPPVSPPLRHGPPSKNFPRPQLTSAVSPAKQMAVSPGYDTRRPKARAEGSSAHRPPPPAPLVAGQRIPPCPAAPEPGGTRSFGQDGPAGRCTHDAYVRELRVGSAARHAPTALGGEPPLAAGCPPARRGAAARPYPARADPRCQSGPGQRRREIAVGPPLPPAPSHRSGQPESGRPGGLPSVALGSGARPKLARLSPPSSPLSADVHSQVGVERQPRLGLLGARRWVE
mmetsp:Transcript_63272/g.145496  ORF Transcript_63272/g.145496 Transcript_63272/m.145496 type:complete len:253 (+) Transcript_63272:698-1456(+)